MYSLKYILLYIFINFFFFFSYTDEAMISTVFNINDTTIEISLSVLNLM